MSEGSYALVSGSGQSLPASAETWELIDMGTIGTDDDNILTETSGGVYRPDEEGYYLILPAARHLLTHNNRHNAEFKVTKNTADYAGAINSGYGRNSSNDLSYFKPFFIGHFNGTTDTFEVYQRREVGDGTPAGTYAATRVKVIQLTAGAATATPFAHYGTPTSGAYGGTTPTAISGWDVITETDTSVIELQAGGTAIRLKEANRAYLVAYGLPTDVAGNNRTGRISDITLGGTRINHSFGEEYQRDSGTSYCAPAGLALAYPTVANQDLNVRMWMHTAPGWGTPLDQTWSLSSAAGRAGIMVLALPPGAEFHIFEDTVGGVAFAAAGVDMNAANATAHSNGTKFTRDNATDVTVPGSHGVFAHANYLFERTVSSGTRLTLEMQFEIEATNADNTRNGDYLRGDQGSADHVNAAISIDYVGTPAAGDTFQVEMLDSVPGTDDGSGNDRTVAGGSFYIDLTTLASGGGSVPVSVGHFASTPTFFAPNAETEVDASVPHLATTPSFFAPSAEPSVDATVSYLATAPDFFTPTSVVEVDVTVPFLATTPTFYGINSPTGIVAALSTHFADGDATTQRLTNNGGTFTAGEIKETDGATGNIDMANNGETEVEINLRALGAVVDGKTYEFRLVLADGTPLDTYTNTPKVTFDDSGAQPATVPYFASTPTFFTPTADVEVDVTVPLLSTTPTFFSPSATTDTDVLVPHVATVPSFFTPTSDVEVDAAVPHLATSPTFFTPTAVTEVNASVPHLASVPTFYTPTALTDTDVTVPHLATTPTIYTPMGVVGVAVPHLATSPTFYAPGAVVDTPVAVPHLATTPQFFTPSTETATDVTVPHVSTVPTFYAPAATVEVDASIGYLATLPTFYAPSADVEIDAVVAHLATSPVFYSPTAVVDVPATVPHLATVPTIYGPSATTDTDVTVSYLTTTPAFFTPTGSAEGEEPVPNLATVPTFYTPNVVVDLPVSVPHLATDPTFYSPAAVAETDVVVTYVGTTPTFFTPGVVTEVDPQVPYVATTPVFYTPSSTGDIGAAVSYMATEPSFYTVTATTDLDITVGHLGTTPVFYTPAADVEPLVDVGYLATEPTFYTVTFDVELDVVVPYLATEPDIFTPGATTDQTLAVAFLTTTPTIYGPLVTVYAPDSLLGLRLVAVRPLHTLQAAPVPVYGSLEARPLANTHAAWPIHALSDVKPDNRATESS